MFISSNIDSREAVIFFSKGKVIKQMLYGEFETALDGVFAISEFAGKSVDAVFLRIDSSLRIQAAVFFIMVFNKKGFADERWNLPLRQMSEQGLEGPDLGVGPIQLVCKSACPAAWHRSALWDPTISKNNNTFVLLKNVIQENKLGLTYDEPEETVSDVEQAVAEKQPELSVDEKKELVLKVARHIEKRNKGKVAELTKEYELKIITMENSFKDEIETLHRGYQAEISSLKADITTLHEDLDEQKARAGQLLERITLQSGEFQTLREKMVEQLISDHVLEKDAVEALKEEFALELKIKLENETASLNAEMEQQSLALFYRNETIASLQKDIDKLQEDKAKLLTHGSDNALVQLANNGVNFVVWNPATGHVSIPLVDIPRFLDSEDQFFADYIGVKTDVYKAWSNHYDFPRCQHECEQGDLCGEVIKRVESPLTFKLEESDRCNVHRP